MEKRKADVEADTRSGELTRRSLGRRDYGKDAGMSTEIAVQRVRIAQILAKGSCPICAALKVFQDGLLESPGTVEFAHLCQHHTWALAKSAPGSVAAESFLRALRLVKEGPPPRRASGCDMCKRIHEEETTRIQELTDDLKRRVVLEWMRKQGTICARHAHTLSEQVPAHLRKDVAAILQRTIAELNQDLETFLGHTRSGVHTGGGVLGRAAEFLAAQRGILD